ncbi:lipocalin family protein [Alistipes sp.]|uniref:lipocalin family protein n=1 Tax=Alistipes sp. TaxID=1872444 RepID=UPI003AF07CA3
MKNIRILVSAAALVGLAACCSNEPKTFTGVITDATMNTVTVKADAEDKTITFTTENADMAQANGLLLGAPVVVDYKGCLKDVMPATKVATDATYAQAVGRWTMPDPNDPEAVMGVEIEIEGAAESINMATLRYTSWELSGEADKIILKGESEGSGEPIAFTQTGILAKNAEGVWTLAIEGTEVVYTQQANM